MFDTVDPRLILGIFTRTGVLEPWVTLFDPLWTLETRWLQYETAGGVDCRILQGGALKFLGLAGVGNVRHEAAGGLKPCTSPGIVEFFLTRPFPTAYRSERSKSGY